MFIAITKNPQIAYPGWKNKHNGPLCTAGPSSGLSRNELDAFEYWREFQRQDATEAKPQMPHTLLFHLYDI